MPWRVVFDTNVMISGLLWRVKPYQCFQFARSGVVEACYCQEMLTELGQKLKSKFGFPEERVAQILEDWQPKAIEIEIRGDLRVVTPTRMTTCSWSARSGRERSSLSRATDTSKSWASTAE